MKILPKEYAKAQGTPFRVEDYNGAKLEIYYLDDRSDYGKFAQRGRFSVWTSNGTDYRLFVDKGYYAAVEDLYRNDVNTIWLDFTNSIYKAHQGMSKKFMFIQLGIFGVVFALLMTLPQIFPSIADAVFLVAMIVMFVGIMVASQIQQKKLKQIVAAENTKASELIKETLGADNFQTVLNAQEKYYENYFKPAPDLEDEVEALPEKTEDAETTENTEESENQNNE